MYNLVIVDDEGAIRRGMCNYIPWNDMGFKVVADFEDGKETIDYINNNKVDVIVTDIEMAEITGLELTKYIYENKIDIKVVILSGYKHFEYAKKAVEYKVEHYLLKPLHMEEVKEVFGKIKKDLDNKNEKIKSIQKEEKEFRKILSELKEQFFINLLIGGIKDEGTIQKKCKLLHLNLNMDRPYALLDLKIKQMDINKISFYEHQEAKEQILYSMFQQDNKEMQFYIVKLSSDTIKIIATHNSQISTKEFKKALEEQINEKCQATLKLFEVSIIINIENIFNSMNELLNYKYSLQMRVQDKSNKLKLVPEDYERLIQKYKLMIEIINDMDFESLDSLIDNMFYEFRNLAISHVKQIIINMFSMLSTRFMKMGSDLWIHINEKINYQIIMDAKTLSELKKICKEQLEYIISIVDNVQNDVSKNVVNKAMDYIKEYYGEDISLESVADRYFLSPSYFSRLFKQYTGITFTDYLVEIRMNKAKELLCTGKYKVYEVSQMVGYKSEKYFFRVFKQYTGYAPSEYYRSRLFLNDQVK